MNELGSGAAGAAGGGVGCTCCTGGDDTDVNNELEDGAVGGAAGESKSPRMSLTELFVAGCGPDVDCEAPLLPKISSRRLWLFSTFGVGAVLTGLVAPRSSPNKSAYGEQILKTIRQINVDPALTSFDTDVEPTGLFSTTICRDERIVNLLKMRKQLTDAHHGSLQLRRRHSF